MKYSIYILAFLLVLTGCKAKKNIIDNNAIATNMSARKVGKKHESARFDEKTVDAKLKVKYKDATENISFSVRMKIEKDKAIWLKGTKYITVFRALITPTEIKYFSPYKKNYITGDFSMLKELLGTEVSFTQLQSMLLGEAILNLKKEKQEVEVVNNTYKLTPKKSSNLLRLLFMVNPSHFKLDKQSVIDPMKDQRLDVSYPKYSLKDNVVFPDAINILAKDHKKFTQIGITVRSVKFNTTLSMPFKIPSHYKRIEL